MVWKLFECVASQWRKRQRYPATAEATNNTQGARNGLGRIGNDESAIPPGINRVAETQPVRAPLKTILFGENLPGFDLDPIVFLDADSSEPAHLSQLILLAGDIETNPGPELCGICNKRVTSNSVKCTWCEKWIHQRCSGLLKSDIVQMARDTTYRYECDNCKVTWPLPGQGSPTDTTRGPSPCIHPVQEPTATNEPPTRTNSPFTPSLPLLHQCFH